MIRVDQLRELIIRPVIKALGWDSPAAENLLVLTALTESAVTSRAGNVDTALKQLGNGPALGPFQMEPATHDDIWKNWLAYNDGAARHLLGLIGVKQSAGLMVGNLWYAAAMCRVHYRRVPSALPSAGDVRGLAQYWKDHYNTRLGSGDPAHAERMYRKYGEA